MQLLALPLAGLSFASTKPLASNLVFQEEDGVVAVEAEHFVSQEKSDVRAWHIISTENAPEIKPDGDPSHADTASGGAYLEILPDTRRSHGDKLIQNENFTNTPGKMAILTYPIHFKTAGRYYCWVRTFSTNTEDNGIHLGLNGTWPESGARMQWTKKKEWAWDTKQRTEKVHIGVFGQIWIDIPKPGVHKIHFSMREDGFEFDKFILTTAKPDQAKPPQAHGPATRVKIGTAPDPFKAGAKPKQASRFPKHWGAPPEIQTMDIVDLPAPYGKGSSTLKSWIQAKQKADRVGKKTRFPKHWGDQPKIQTRDLVKLPGKYGRGSSTLRNWILENQKKDAANKVTLKIKAADIPAKGGFYLDKGKWLAINPEQNKSAETTLAFPYPSGKYHLTLQGVGENDGEAHHEIFLNDKSILKFTIPLSKETYETGAKFHKSVNNIFFGAGEDLKIKSKVASADGKEFSRARLAALVFTPANDNTLMAALVGITADDANTYVPKLPDLQLPRQPHGDGSIDITGANTQWQPVNLTLDGPFANELDQKPNPFRDHSLVVTFTHSSGSPEYHVPGYFAADGIAAESSAKSGIKWRAHFSPDQPGEWTYNTTFLTGKDVALMPTGKFPDKPVETLKKFNKSGKITIAPAPADAPGFYSEGRLTYVGKPYLQFAGSKRYFLKAGADAPETLLGYADFDGTTASTKKVPLKHYKPHLQDWKQGDPTWKNGKGKGLIGALNYLSGKGMNAFSFLPYNAGGDGDNIWPFVSRNEKFNYDCSKLDQWNVVFNHAQAKGLFLHFKLQETENDDNNRGGHNGDRIGKVPTSLDGGDLGPERKLYCREIVARFGHHLALNWNLGEENTQTTKQQMDMANYIRAFDPYDHHLVVHTYPNQQDKIYNALLGAEAFTGVSLQNSNLKDVHWQTVKWHRASVKAKHPWCVAFDEPGDAQVGMPPDPDYPGMPKDYDGPSIDDTRKWVLWGNLLGGGWGVEYYFGYKLPQNDLVCEDWRSRDQSWDYAKIALDFFRDQKIPFDQMTPNPEAVGNPEKGNQTYCLSGKRIHVLAFPDGGSCKLILPEGKTARTIQWFNPRNGKIQDVFALADHTITAPDKKDWVAIVRTN